MKTRTKSLFLSGLLFFATLSWVAVASALTLTDGAVGGGTVGSALGGGAWIDNQVGFGTKITNVDEYNANGPVSYNYPLPVATVATPWPSTLLGGYSDAGNMDMGAATYSRDNNSNVSLTSTFGNRITVIGGDGTAYGDLTQLTVTIQLDGGTNTSADRSSASKSIALLDSVYKLWDTSQAGNDFDPYLLRFNASIWNEKQTIGNGTLQHDYTWNWKVTDGLSYGTRNNVLDFDNGSSSSFLQANQTESCLGLSSCYESFDTGVLEFTVDTYIGAELTAFGWMQAGSSLTGPGSAYAGFLDTFGSTITAADGIQLNFAVIPPETGPAPVPEPSTFLLLGGGLTGLAFFARRRRKE